MKLFTTLLAVLISVTALAQTPPPVSLKGQSGTKLLPKWNLQVPYKQATNLGGIDALIETGNPNLLANPGFEGTTFTECVFYDDGDNTRPVDGTGDDGARTNYLSIGTQFSTMGYGIKEGIITKASGDARGQGIACSFTAPEGSTLWVKGKYKTSANYADYPGVVFPSSDVGIYVYDSTNSVLIEAPDADVAATSIKGELFHKFSLPAVGSGGLINGRILYHVQTTNSSAWAMLLDERFFGEDNPTSGAPDIDLGTFTTSLSSSGGGAITLNATGKTDPNFYCSQKGSYLNCTLAFRNGSGGAASGSAGNILINLPAGYQIDVAKMAQSGSIDRKVGTCIVVGASANNGPCVLSYETTTSLNVSQVDATTFTLSELTALAGLYGNISIPIVGWSSNMALSSEGGTREIEFKAYAGSNLTGITPNTSYSKITFDTVDYDTTGDFNTSTQRYVLSESGKYECNYGASFANTNVLNSGYFISLHRNGTPLKGGSGNRVTPAATTQFGSVGSTDFIGVKGDYLEVYLYGVGNNSSSTLTAIANWTYFSCKKKSNPQTVGTVPSYSGRWENTAGTNMPNNSATLIPWATQKDNTGIGTMDGSGNLTLRYSGRYIACASVELTSSAGWNGTTEDSTLAVYRNATEYVARARQAIPPSANFGQSTCAAPFFAASGDTVQVYLLQASGGDILLRSTTGVNYFGVTRIGD